MIGEDYAPLQAIDKMKGDFENATGIKVEVERYEAEAVLQKVAFDLNSKAGHYDLIVQVYFDMGRLVTQQQLRPLTEFLADSKLHDPLFNPDGDLFPVWKTMGWYDGKPFGYPMMVLTMYTWYRKDLFEDQTERARFRERFGYELAAPSDWRQYRDIAEFFTRPERGLYGTLIQGKKHMALWQEYINFLYSFGGAILDTRDPSKYGPIVINSPAAIAATEYYKALLKYAPADSLSFTWDDALALMQQGKVAMCLMWTDSTYTLEDPQQSKVAGKMGYCMIPAGSAGRMHQIGGQSYYIPATSRSPEAAYLFVEWMLRADSQVRQQKLGGASPRKSTYEDSEVVSLPWTRTSIDALKNTHPAMLYTIPESLQIGEVIKTAISEALAGQKSVKDSLDSAALQIKALLGEKAELKYPPR
ncbi:putative ABC transporter-binding protein precursor [Phycisphaerae bacterium RAS1]|nr:putative ABC transporter-binding protein precursor [Phycisphaerae bacterium RAS1]